MCLTQANPPSRTEVEKKSLAESHGSRLNNYCYKKSCTRVFLLHFYKLYQLQLDIFSLSLQTIKCDTDCVVAFKMEAGLGC